MTSPSALTRKRFAQVSLASLLGVRALPLRKSSSAEPRSWPIELRSGHFEIHSDLAELDKDTLLAHLSGVIDDVDRLLEVSMPSEPVHVVLFGTEAEYERYMQNYFPAVPKRRAIFMQDRGPGMLFAYWHNDLATDLRHEVVHALLNDATGTVPMWLDEGIAEYFEVAPDERFGGSGHLRPTVARVRLGFVPPLASLESLESVGDFSAAHYRDSWAWVHYMMHRRLSTRLLLVRYLAERRSGADTLPLHRQLPQIVTNFESDFLEHYAHFQSSAS